MIIGIDLGTTFSAAAYLDQEGMPRLIDNNRGDRLTPSIVLEDADGTMVVGEDARENMVLMGDSVISTIKDFMGTEQKFTLASGNTYQPWLNLKAPAGNSCPWRMCSWKPESLPRHSFSSHRRKRKWMKRRLPG